MIDYSSLNKEIVKKLRPLEDIVILVLNKTKLSNKQLMIKIINKLRKYDYISTIEKNYSIWWKINNDFSSALPTILKEITEDHIKPIS